MNIIQLGLRGLQFLWTLLIISLVGNMIAEASGGNPSSVNFAMFCAVFAMLSLLYLIPATIKEGLAHPLVVLGLDALNTLFFFAAAIALAAALGVHSCGNIGYINTNGVTNGTSRGNRGKRCHEGQASDAFLWFGFAAWAASAVMSVLGGGLSGGSTGIRRPGGIRRGGPSMSQV